MDYYFASKIPCFLVHAGFVEHEGYCTHSYIPCNTGYCCTERSGSSWSHPMCCSYNDYCEEEWCADDW